MQSALDRTEQIVCTIKQSTSGDTVILGDLNIDLLTANSHSKRITQFWNACRVKQVISGPTRISKKSSTLIDHIFTNSPHLASHGSIDCYITDHLPIFLVLKKTRAVSQFREVIGRSYRDFDKPEFESDIWEIKMEEIFIDSNPERSWDRLFARICQIIDTHCPLRTL